MFSFINLLRITGGELFDRIIELSRYSERDATRVMKDALLGLKHMHDLGFAHRDIKVDFIDSKQSFKNARSLSFSSFLEFDHFYTESFCYFAFSLGVDVHQIL